MLTFIYEDKNWKIPYRTEMEQKRQRVKKITDDQMLPVVPV
jgi:hypothetical protein